MKKSLIIHIEKCVGCHSCEFACAVAHSSTKDMMSVIRAGEKPGYRLFVEPYQGMAVPVHCNHCEEAACMLACPTGAIYREEEDGPVLLDVARCIGCKMCVQACPFGVMTVSSDGKGVLKCDLCIERLAEGQVPACVESCKTKAVTFVSEEEASRSKRGKSAERRSVAQQEGQRELMIND